MSNRLIYWTKPDLHRSTQLPHLHPGAKHITLYECNEPLPLLQEQGMKGDSFSDPFSRHASHLFVLLTGRKGTRSVRKIALICHHLNLVNVDSSTVMMNDLNLHRSRLLDSTCPTHLACSSKTKKLELLESRKFQCATLKGDTFQWTHTSRILLKILEVNGLKLH